MEHPARPHRDRIAGLHDRLQVMEERLSVLENDLREALDARARWFEPLPPARLRPRVVRPLKASRVVVRERPAPSTAEDLVLEVGAR